MITKKKAKRILSAIKKPLTIPKDIIDNTDNLTNTILLMKMIYRGGLIRCTDAYYGLYLQITAPVLFDFLRNDCEPLLKNIPVDENDHYMICVSRNAQTYCQVTIAESHDFDDDDGEIINVFSIKPDANIGLIKMLLYDMIADYTHFIIEDPDFDSYFAEEDEDEDNHPTIHVFMDKIAADSIPEGYEMIHTFNELMDAIMNKQNEIYTTQLIGVAMLSCINPSTIITLSCGGGQISFTLDSYKDYVKGSIIEPYNMKELFASPDVKDSRSFAMDKLNDWKKMSAY